MLADNSSAADVERRRKPAVYAERLRTRGGANYIDDGVHCANFMEMHLLDGNGMYSGFGLTQ